MGMDRRKFLESLGGVALVSILADAEKGSDMWGMIAKISVLPGKRDEMIGILKSSAANMPGCFSYVVAKDATEENVMWVTEVWDSQAGHDASLSLPAVKEAIPRGQALVASFERLAVTTPVWGVGLPKAEPR
jgi:quinol monooxygenase YgiN